MKSNFVKKPAESEVSNGSIYYLGVNDKWPVGDVPSREIYL